MNNLWWLSFCDPEHTAGSQFLGVAITRGSDLHDALRRAWALGINPGGQVAGRQLPPGSDTRFEGHCDRLLSRAEAEQVSRTN